LPVPVQLIRLERLVSELTCNVLMRVKPYSLTHFCMPQLQHQLLYWMLPKPMSW